MPRGTAPFFHFSPLRIDVIVRPVMSVDVEEELFLSGKNEAPEERQ